MLSIASIHKSVYSITDYWLSMNNRTSGVHHCGTPHIQYSYDFSFWSSRPLTGTTSGQARKSPKEKSLWRWSDQNLSCAACPSGSSSTSVTAQTSLILRTSNANSANTKRMIESKQFCYKLPAVTHQLICCSLWNINIPNHRLHCGLLQLLHPRRMQIQHWTLQRRFPIQTAVQSTTYITHFHTHTHTCVHTGWNKSVHSYSNSSLNSNVSELQIF